MTGASDTVHGTAVAHGDVAALIRGPSGAGKSDLALRCLVQASSTLIPGPVRLVGDDYVVVTRCDGELKVSAPEAISGKLEVRGMGIIDVAPLACARLVMIVDLVAPRDIARLPDPVPVAMILGVGVPILHLHAFEAAAAAKLLVALARGGLFSGFLDSRRAR